MSKNKSVVCAIIKNEQRFIREWVNHYLNIGFDVLYLYEDFDSTSHKEDLQDFIRDGKAVLTNLAKTKVIPHYSKGTEVQMQLYSYFLDKCKKEKIADWIGFFDVDEFLVFEKDYSLQRLEKEYKDEAGIVLSWVIYGANGHIKRPEGNVVENYTSHLPLGTLLDFKTQWNVKSLVNVKNCEGAYHNHVFKGCVNTDGNLFIPKDNLELTFSKAWLNHYYSKSWEDYLDRIFSRGNMQNNFRCLDKFFFCSPEFLPKKEEMILSQRYIHVASTMWISRDMKIISGGNDERLEELRQKYVMK